MTEKYYVLNLWDYGTPAFVSFDKMYIGTEADIRAAMRSMKKKNADSETVKALERYFGGDKNATHNIAYNEIPILEPCTYIASSTITLGEYSWEHTNVWGYPYYMKCDSAEVKQIIVRYKKGIIVVSGRGFKIFVMVYRPKNTVCLVIFTSVRPSCSMLRTSLTRGGRCAIDCMLSRKYIRNLMMRKTNSWRKNTLNLRDFATIFLRTDDIKLWK